LSILISTNVGEKAIQKQTSRFDREKEHQIEEEEVGGRKKEEPEKLS